QDLVLLLQQTHTSLEVAHLGSILARCPGADTGLDAGLADPFVQRHLVDAEALRDLRDGDAVLTRTGRTTSSRNSWDRERASCTSFQATRRQARSDVTYPRGGPQRLQAGALASEGGGRLGTGRDERWGVHGPTGEGPTAGANGGLGWRSARRAPERARADHGEGG